MSQDNEPSILEYARFYGLTRDHLEDDPLQQLADFHADPLDLEDNPDLFSIREDTVKVPAERLTFDEGAATFLSSVLALAHQPPPQSDVDDEIDIHRFQRMKLEVPLLRSDPEVDLMRFKAPIIPDLEHEFLPLETVDEEADEGLTWPTWYDDLAREFERKIETEKLQVDKDALLFLQETLNYHVKGGLYEEFEDVELPYTKKYKVEPVSPPLLPRSPEVLPYVPSSDTRRIELLSDHTSPTRDELRDAERVIFAGDAVVSKKAAQINSQNSDPLAETGCDLPPLIPTPENVSSDDIDKIFAETILPAGIKVQHRVEHEQLQAADRICRVTVPTMDFSLPIPPWKRDMESPGSGKHDIASAFMSGIKAAHFSNGAWPLSRKAERELKWTPFPAALGKVEIQETISDDDDLLEEYIAQPESTDVTTLTPKPPGLCILDELADSQEELEPATFLEENDIQSLVRKRKYELEVDNSSSHPRGKLKKDTSTVAASLEPFSTVNALATYMDVRRGNVPKPNVEAVKDTPKPADVQKAKAMADLPEGNRVRNTSVPKPNLPTPPIATPTLAVPFIVSTSFFSNRQLARHVQSLYPSAELIERDFNLYLEPQERPNPKAKGTPILQSSLADEADLILSPGAGIMWTTLQKIKQRSLPGQVARSAVKERLVRTSPRYERLIVLIPDPRADERNELDKDDCETLIDLTSFCSTLESDIQVTFISGGEDNLAKWIVAFMIKYGVTDPDLKLIQDDTLWEVFLRRAGMNAFAAQAILAKLKAPDQDEPDFSGKHGLAAFVQMSVEERFAVFEALLGGRKLLTRVSEVLDAMW